VQVSAKPANTGREVPCEGFLFARHATVPQGDNIVDQYACSSPFDWVSQKLRIIQNTVFGDIRKCFENDRSISKEVTMGRSNSM